MVNSASQALAEFKSQKMGGLLSGFSSTVAAPTIASTSLADSASSRMNRSKPKSSALDFMYQIRQSGKRYNNDTLRSVAARQTIPTDHTGYQLPTGGTAPKRGGPRGQYGLELPAVAAFNKLSQAYSRAGMGNLKVNSGGRTFDEQAKLYADYKAGRGNKAAAPGSSLHESGIAVDLGGPLYNTNMKVAMATKQHQWMRQNAAQFGWYWVGKSFGESWHWEYHPEYKSR